MKIGSFLIALGLHGVVLVFVAFPVKKKVPETFSFNSKNSIQLSFGDKPNPEVGLKLKKNVPKLKQNFAVSSYEGKENFSTKIENTDGTSSEGQEWGFEESVVSYKAPEYPSMARKRGWEGKTKLRLEVSMEGVLVEAQILESSGHAALDQAALGAAKEWRFQKRSGKGRYFVEKTIIFELRG